MSRLAKKPIIVSDGVTVSLGDKEVIARGLRGELKLKILPKIKLRMEKNNIWVECEDRDKQGFINLGTMWSLLSNLIAGVSQGFVKILEIEGIGYRAVMEAGELVLFLGYVNPVRLAIPEGITVTVEKSSIKIFGNDKSLVGRIAAQIRALKKPEPYKGKGIRYQNEIIKRKAGKKAATVGGSTA